LAAHLWAVVPKLGLQVNVPVPGGTRTPFGLVAMTDAEKQARKADILAHVNE
jgi:hypothetical protein